MANILIGLALVAFVAVRQLRARPARETSAARLVLILAVIGVVETVNATKGHTVAAETIALIAASVVIGGALGALRAQTVKVWRDGDGVAWQKGTWVTAVLWVVAIGAHLGLEALIDASTSIHGLGAATLLAYLAVTLGAQREVVRYRVAQIVATQTPR